MWRNIVIPFLSSLIVLDIFSDVRVAANNSIDDFEDSGRYAIVGKVYPPELLSSDMNWQRDTSVVINGGEYQGFLREDGSFTINSIASGSYVVEIVNPDYFYEPVSTI